MRVRFYLKMTCGRCGAYAHSLPPQPSSPLRVGQLPFCACWHDISPRAPNVQGAAGHQASVGADGGGGRAHSGAAVQAGQALPAPGRPPKRLQWHELHPELRRCVGRAIPGLRRARAADSCPCPLPPPSPLLRCPRQAGRDGGAARRGDAGGAGGCHARRRHEDGFCHRPTQVRLGRVRRVTEPLPSPPGPICVRDTHTPPSPPLPLSGRSSLSPTPTPREVAAAARASTCDNMRELEQRKRSNRVPPLSGLGSAALHLRVTSYNSSGTPSLAEPSVYLNFILGPPLRSRPSVSLPHPVVTVRNMRLSLSNLVPLGLWHP